ncbi:hypothetical protein BRADI_1g22530v3 [Brachypodium distachyon]|uniref:F-box associated domain-containing protein n=1 Tax=Brachypodium distachyon TaxID=15368 RepID=I1GSQ0_BRADI|nr:hypothetical protein BRADI_1g22530v3 [Brachypodium distachyon]
MELLGCRHGRIFFFDGMLHEVMVFDPATTDRRRVAVPPVYDEKEVGIFNGAVLCTASDEATCILIGVHCDNDRAFGSVYSSETGTLGDLISTAAIRYMI